MRLLLPARKLLASVAVLGTAAGAAGLGTYAGFTDTVDASAQISTGTLDLALGDVGAVTNRLGVNVSNLLPGASVQRSFDLRNAGTVNFASLTLTTSATVSSVLDTDVTKGVQMQIERCPGGWTETGSLPSFGYSCASGRTTVVASRPVVASNLALGGPSLTAGATDHLLLTLTLPLAADDTFQGKSSTLDYSFRAAS